MRALDRSSMRERENLHEREELHERETTTLPRLSLILAITPCYLHQLRVVYFPSASYWAMATHLVGLHLGT